MLLVFATLVVLLFGGVIGIFVVVARLLSASKNHVAAIATEIRSGAITGMIHWHPSVLVHMSSDWVGASHYARGAFGHRDSAAGKVFAPALRGFVLGFVCETEGRGARGRIEITTSLARFVGQFDGGLVWFSSAAGPLGAVVLQTGVLLDPGGIAIGEYQRGGAGPFSPLFLRGRCVAGIQRVGESHAQVPASSRPLLTAVDVRSPEEEAWVVVIAVLELGHLGVTQTHEGMRMRGSNLGVP